MERFGFRDKSPTVTLPYTITYFKINNYYIIIDGNGTHEDDYLYATDRDMLHCLIEEHWNVRHYGFLIAYLVKEREPAKDLDISKILKSEVFIKFIKDTDLLDSVFHRIKDIDSTVIREFVNNIHTSRYVINSIAKEALRSDRIEGFTDVFQSPICDQSYVTEFIETQLPELSYSYALALREKGKLSPTNTFLVDRLI